MGSKFKELKAEDAGLCVCVCVYVVPPVWR